MEGASTTLDAYKGCQHGVAVEVGSDEPLEPGHAVLSSLRADGYEKNGPTANGAGSTLIVEYSTISGEGPSPYIGQNGIQFGFGAQGVVDSSTITGNECDVASCGATGEQAAGVLFYQVGEASSISDSTVNDNDLGIYYASDSAKLPARPILMSKDTLTSNRYEGVYLEEGNALLESLVIDGSGRIGVELAQYAGQKSKILAAAKETKISGQSEASIKVTSDKQPGDIAGSFVFTGGAAATPRLINESSNFTVAF